MGSSVAIAMPLAARAQTAGDQAAAERGAADGDIVVTARKRAEDLQTVPIAITALSGAAIEARQISSVTDVARLSPNVSLTQGAFSSGSSTNLTAFIRGVGQTEFQIATEPGVGIYVDGIYIARSIGSLLDIADTQSIQVLRGPQGILFGKNTIGGAVIVTSNRPQKATELSGDLTIGEDHRIDVKAMGNMAITDNLYARVAISSRDRDGYMRRLATGEREGNNNSQGVRGSLLWDGGGSGTLLLSADYSRVREAQQPQTLGAVNLDGPIVAFYNNFIAGGVCAGPTPADAPNCYTNRWVTGSKTTNYAGGPNRSDLDALGLTANYELQFSGMTFRSISGYRYTDNFMSFDADGAPFEMISVRERIKTRQYSQEFQLLGDAFDKRVNWIVGAFYLHEKGTDNSPVYVSLARFENDVRLKSNSYAAFGQINWDITDRLNLSLGGRYTKEIKRFSPDSFIVEDNTGGSLLALSQLTIPDPALNPDGRRLVPLGRQKARASVFDPAVTLSYKVSDDIFTYATYSEGFKGGGFTQKVFPSQPTVPSFQPESVNNYELGLRVKALDRRLNFSLAGFRTDYNDLQIVLRQGITPTITNAGKARIKGVEFEGNATLVPAVRLFGSLAYLDARYLQLDAATGLTLDDKFVYSPTWSGLIGADVDVIDSDRLKTTARFDASYRSRTFVDATNDPASLQKAYWLFNASLTVAGPDGQPWSASVGAENLTNKRYLMTATAQLQSAGNSLLSYARGRALFVRLRYHFRD
nr:TonB-dependent receptor [Sphingomonas sp. Y57]